MKGNSHRDLHDEGGGEEDVAVGPQSGGPSERLRECTDDEGRVDDPVLAPVGLVAVDH